jgi:sugar lactone lactonase YvrE
LPNGIALASNRDLLIANIGTGALERMSGDGTTRVLFDSIDGKPIGKVNFVLRDSMDRLWISVSTRVDRIAEAVRPGLADGYIALADDRGIRVVADGFHFANEVRFDAREEWLYVVETTAQRISRLRAGSDGTLGGREIFGPASLAPGFPDGITFDSAGNLWCAIAMADRLVALTPQGDVLTLYADGDPAAARVMDSHFNAGSMTGDLMTRAAGKLAPGMASIAFGGSELRTVFIGSSMGTSIPSFTSPVAGLPLAHQREG